jgi:hypothetical protein
MMAEKGGGRVWPGLILVILALPVHLGWVFWKLIKKKVNSRLRGSLNEIATDARWWVATLLVLLFGLSVFPFIDVQSNSLAAWGAALTACVAAMVTIAFSKSNPTAAAQPPVAVSEAAVREQNESPRDILLLLDFGITQTTIAMLDGLLRMGPEMPPYEGEFKLRDDFALRHDASVDFVRHVGIKLERGSWRQQSFLSVMQYAENDAEREVEQTPIEVRPAGVDPLSLRKYAIAYLKCVTAIGFLRSQKREAEEKLVGQRSGLIERMQLKNAS